MPENFDGPCKLFATRRALYGNALYSDCYRITALQLTITNVLLAAIALFSAIVGSNAVPLRLLF